MIRTVRFLILLQATLAGNALQAYEIPTIEDFSHWQLRELNPASLREGVFYYGIVIEGKVYISSLWEKEAEIGRRAGGHFKLLMGVMRERAKQRGLSEEKTEAIVRNFREAQAKRQGQFHGARAFGFKAIRDKRGRLVLKWHGFNSFKSTIHATSFDRKGVNIPELISDLARKYGAAGTHLAHPTNDADLELNPKYLDRENKVYRGERELWQRSFAMGANLKAVNDSLGYSNEQLSWVLSSDPSLVGCSKIDAWMAHIR